ncbi:translation initiation factor IF-2-like [Lutra lutra]|uniref:translation initiation factor IF-2-like n=1 Tax=Lutra lutra TaxID=9657 RepID=UPI001FD4EEAC|nr:translation initiation factor IF-2-like [Lutra lutra]
MVFEAWHGLCGSALRSPVAGRAPGLRARLGLRSPRVPSSFARPELRCSRRPERRGRAVSSEARGTGGPAGPGATRGTGAARSRPQASPRPGRRPNNLALCSPRAPLRPPRSGFGAGPPAPAGARPDPGTREFVTDVCGAAWAELYAQRMEFREGKSGSRETSWTRGYVRGQDGKIEGAEAEMV